MSEPTQKAPRILFEASAHRIATASSLAMVYEDDVKDPRRALIAQVVQDIGIDLWIELGSLRVTLAMLDDPDHWADDWKAAFEEAGMDPDTDVDEFIAGLAS